MMSERRKATMPAEGLHLEEGERITKTEIKGNVLEFTIVTSLTNETKERTYQVGDFARSVEAFHARHQPLNREQLDEVAGDDPRLRRLLIEKAQSFSVTECDREEVLTMTT